MSSLPPVVQLIHRQLVNAPSEIALASVPRAGHHTILVVDDEPISLQLLHSQLRVEGFSVVKAHNGEEALNLLAQGLQPDAIILDVVMPKLNGYEVTQQIRSLYTSRIPIILLTAKAREEDLVEGLAKGANDYLTKPFKKSELIARLRTHLTLSKFDAAARRFVPFTFLEILGKKSLIDVTLGEGVQKEMSVLFADIRSFTTLSEKLGPQRIFATINRYLSFIQPAVHAHQGFINQIYGDGIMALFVGKPSDAVSASVTMHQALSVFNEGQITADNPPFKIGIGINTGQLMLGTLGDADRMGCGVIADTVNIASHIEGMTKMYGSAVLIGEKTHQRLSPQDQATLREVDRVILKGKVEPTSIYEVIDADSSPLRATKIKTLAVFATGLKLYRNAQFRDASHHFAACIQADNSDKAATIYFERCTNYAEAIPPNFDGITRLEDK
ncbi:MAG: adenylate/guanylate cyclase domain-containing response regulator [Pedosphaera sp.]|nr:adenylate/guanylate cyclase domain-containing response regulator [Pedosphaera sp.]